MYKQAPVSSVADIMLNTLGKTEGLGPVPYPVHLPYSTSFHIPFLSILFSHAQQITVLPTDILLNDIENKHHPHDSKRMW